MVDSWSNRSVFDYAVDLKMSFIVRSDDKAKTVERLVENTAGKFAKRERWNCAANSTRYRDG